MRYAIVGGIVWLGLFTTSLPGSGELEPIARLLLLAILVFTPLALPLAATPDRVGRLPLPYRVAQMAQAPAAALAVVSFFLPTGLPAALSASGWLAFTGLVALFGPARFLTRRFVRADEVCIDAGLIYLSIGGAWLVLSRLGANPLGFGDTIVLLTAVHFHYAGFAAPILASLAGRTLAEIKPSVWKTFRLISIGLIAGTPLVAIGITLSPVVEVVAAIMLVTSLLLLSFLTAFVIAPAIRPRIAQALLLVSAASSAIAMLAAGVYALGEFTGVTVIGISQMVVIHSWLNAIGFVLCGLVAWAIVQPGPHP